MHNKIFYRWMSLGLFLIELFIAIFVPSQWFIRHSLGDFLVVILLYCLVRSFVDIAPKRLAIYVLVFAFGVEFAQYLRLVDVLGIENHLLRILIGTQFSVVDLIMYTLGCLSVYVLDIFYISKSKT